jgi:hypothetical protein
VGACASQAMATLRQSRSRPFTLETAARPNATEPKRVFGYRLLNAAIACHQGIVNRISLGICSVRSFANDGEPSEHFAWI